MLEGSWSHPLILRGLKGKVVLRSLLLRHANAHNPSNDAARTRLWHGRAGRAIVDRRSKAGISDDDSLSDSEPDVSSDDDGCRSEDEQHPSARKNSRWDEIDEQRLRVYKEEGKDWKWIFKKFPTCPRLLATPSLKLHRASTPHLSQASSSCSHAEYGKSEGTYWYLCAANKQGKLAITSGRLHRRRRWSYVRW
jgi:hypothetical protein